ncbi:GH36-type glycosyl hydrolase domain-containing protein [Tropicimonas isoalkanivorans]|uniref:Cellobiose phosphorylase n=1 Tax=Tropicimonas isoalkanivorans TaxID=441112 RepID=A0A1I1DDU2_9RHOB|nr:cellobiose phosphorylase [Tropicimonas isoalkanivorans]SFB72552.1 Cellobiose phosphorylase [Tropicimonas isoalkanivorans]
MTRDTTETLRTATEADLDLIRIRNEAGIEVSVLPNGAIFALEHTTDGRRIMINQVLGSRIGGGLGRLVLRVGDPNPAIGIIAGSGARGMLGGDRDRIVWQGATGGVAHRVTLSLHPAKPLWFWRIELTNNEDIPAHCDTVFMQDIGLGDRGFLANNEAYACQYLDHHVAPLPAAGPVILMRQNLAQGDAHPWVAHGCLDGVAGFATDFRQILGPHHRDRAGFDLPYGANLRSERLQGECAVAALQSLPCEIAPGQTVSRTFFGSYSPDHPAASGEADMTSLEDVRLASQAFEPRHVALNPIARSVVEDAQPLEVLPMSDADIADRYPERTHEERDGEELLSFFVPAAVGNRHVVAAAKDRRVARRHGTILLSGESWLPTDDVLSLTCWMHGVFGAQLTLGNTSLHKLFSVARDPYNIVRSTGLRILVDLGDGWRHLTTPTLFEMGLQDCRWIYQLADRTITVSTTVAGEAAAQVRVSVDGPACRFLAFGHLVMGERELMQAAPVEIDTESLRATFRPAEGQIWHTHYPQAAFHLVSSTPDSIDAIGSDELLQDAPVDRAGEFIAVRSHATTDFCLSIVGSLTSREEADALAERYSRGVGDEAIREETAPFWQSVTPELAFGGGGETAEAMTTLLPWLVHNGRVHAAVPHGLEQYTGAAWGTRDVCQGPVELLLSLRKDETVRDILIEVLSQQDEVRGDWPQWFMLEPYSFIRDSGAHGDVIIWPLKAVCDYVEETGDFAFLDSSVGWRREGGLAASDQSSPVVDHLERLLAAVESRFLPGTALIQYGHGDWNDSLQPVDRAKRDWMVSSWTVALLYQQLRRYQRILEKAGRGTPAERCETLATQMREDFHRHLVLDGTVAGYAVFDAEDAAPEVLLHPADQTTGVSCSLISITQAVVAGLVTPEQTEHHLNVLRDHLSFPDGVRLMDKPVAYTGGVEKLFRRAESAAFFGREIGLMYVHAHLRYAEMLSELDDAAGFWDALAVINPILVTERLEHAALRQRNAYFSSSDAAFADRYQASAEWDRVKRGTIPVEAGWRIYSSGPGLYINMLMRHGLGARRSFGDAETAPLDLPEGR